MATFNELLAMPAVQRLGWTLLHFLWQGILIGLLCGVFLRLPLAKRARVAYAVCLCGLVLCALFPVATFYAVKPVDAPPALIDTSAVAPEAAGSQVLTAPVFVPEAKNLNAPIASALRMPEADEPLSWHERLAEILAPYVPWLVVGWLPIALVFSLCLGWQWGQTRLWVRAGRPIDKSDTQTLLGKLCARAGVRGKVVLLESARVLGPLTVGFFKPVILVPVGFIAGINPAQLEAILLHELAHIRRWDYLVNLLISLLRALLFYHPVVWWLDRRTRLARELCCDELASGCYGDRATYARALAQLEERLQTGSPLAMAAGDGSLLQRVRSLAGQRGMRGLSGRSLANLSAVFALTLGAVLLLQFAPEAKADDMAQALRKPAPSGRVLDVDGNPMAGAEVALYHMRYAYGLDNGIVAMTQTDAQGRFAFETELTYGDTARDVASENYCLVAWAPGQAVAIAVFERDAETTDDITLALSKPELRKVTIVDKNGKPVVGATVNVGWLVRKRVGAFFKPAFGPLQTVSDAQGIATFTQLPKAGITFEAYKEGFSHEWSDCDSGREPNVEVRLRPGASVGGRVVSTEGTPIAGVLVYAEPTWPLSHDNYARTDAQGYFRLEGLYGKGDAWDASGGTGEYRLRLEDSTLFVSQKLVQLESGQSKTLRDMVAFEGVPVDGVLLDPATKAPVAGAVLQYETDGGKGELITDAQGRFSFKTPEGELWISLKYPPSPFYVLKTPRPLEHGKVGKQALSLELYMPSALKPMRSASGRVLTSEGKPAVGVKVAAQLPQHDRTSPSWILSECSQAETLQSAKTDASGVYVFKEYPADLPMKLVANFGDEAAIMDVPAVTETAQELPILTLKPAQKCRVRVVDIDQKPMAGRKIAYGPLITAAEDGRFNGVPTASQEIQREAKTDADGTFVLEGIPAGYDCVFWLDKDKGYLTWKYVSAAQFSEKNLPNFTLSDVMRLRFLDAEGSPVDVECVAWDEEELMRPADSVRDSSRFSREIKHKNVDAVDGKWVEVSRDHFMFDMPGVAVSLWARTAQGKRLEFFGTLPQFANRMVMKARSDMQKEARKVTPPFALKDDQAAYRVVDAQGRPLEGVRAFFPGAVDDRKFFKGATIDTVTDADGWCVLGGFDRQPYAFYVEFSKTGYATQWTAEVDRAGGRQIVLSQDTRLKGQLVGPEGQNVGRVKMHCATDRSSKTSLTDKSGRKIERIALLAQTDENGCYDFLVSPGVYSVQAESEQGFFLTVPSLVVASGETKAIEQRMGSGAQVIMIFTDSETGQPAQGVCAYVLEEIDGQKWGMRKDSERVSGSDGVVRWDALPPRAASIYRKEGEDMPYARWWTNPPGLRMNGSPQTPPKGDDCARNLYLELREGTQTFSVTVERGVHLSGKVIFPKTYVGPLTVSPVPVRGERNSLTRDSRENIRVDWQTGEFSAWMPAGNGWKYRMCAYLSFYPNEEKQTYLPAALSEPFDSKPGDRFRFELSMLGGGWVKGRVVDAQGRPQAGLRIAGIPSDHAGGICEEPQVVTDKDGRFEMGPIRATEYGFVPTDKLYVHGVDYRDYQRMGTVKEGKHTDLGDITFEKRAPQEVD